MIIKKAVWVMVVSIFSACAMEIDTIKNAEHALYKAILIAVRTRLKQNGHEIYDARIKKIEGRDDGVCISLFDEEKKSRCPSFCSDSAQCHCVIALTDRQKKLFDTEGFRRYFKENRSAELWQYLFDE